MSHKLDHVTRKRMSTWAVWAMAVGWLLHIVGAALEGVIGLQGALIFVYLATGSFGVSLPLGILGRAFWPARIAIFNIILIAAIAILDLIRASWWAQTLGQ